MCEDPSRKFLADLGFALVRLPREGIRPLLVATNRRAGGEVLGPVGDFVVAPGPATPAIIVGEQAANISGTRSSKFELGAGMGVLDRILQGWGVRGINLRASFVKASRVQFEYDNVLTDRVDPSAIGTYLRSATPDLDSPLIDAVDQRGEAVIITQTLKSASFSILSFKETGGAVAADLAGIQQVLDVSGAVRAELSADLKITFRGPVPLAFAFKAFAFWVEVAAGAARFRLSPPGSVGPLAAGATEPPPDDSGRPLGEGPLPLSLPGAGR